MEANPFVNEPYFAPTSYYGFDPTRKGDMRQKINTKQKHSTFSFQLGLRVQEITLIDKGTTSLWGYNVNALTRCEGLVCIYKPLWTKIKS
jgi:hypothetical protein